MPEPIQNDKPQKGKSHGLRLWVAALAALILAAFVVFVVFHAQEIEVTGNTYISDKTVKSWVDVPLGSALLAVCAGGSDTPAAVESIDVSLAAPWKLKITVKEKEIAGFVEQGKSYAYFDADGYVLYVSKEKREDVCKVEGLDTPTLSEGDTLPASRDGLFSDIAETAKTAASVSLTPDAVRIEDGQIYLTFGSVLVSLGDDSLTERVLQLPEILEKLDGKSGTLHLESFGEETQTIWFEQTKN